MPSKAIILRSKLVEGARQHIVILLGDGAFSNALVKKYEAGRPIPINKLIMIAALCAQPQPVRVRLTDWIKTLTLKF